MEEDILSENEVSSLLNSIIEESGNTPENLFSTDENTKPVDENNFEAKIRTILNIVSSQGHKALISIVSLDELNFDFYRMTLPQPCSFFQLLTDKGNLGIDTDRNFTKSFFDAGQQTPDKASINEMMKIIWKILLDKFLKELKYELKEAVYFSMPSKINGFDGNETLSIASLDIDYQNKKYKWSLVIPQKILQQKE